MSLWVRTTKSMVRMRLERPLDDEPRHVGVRGRHDDSSRAGSRPARSRISAFDGVAVDRRDAAGSQRSTSRALQGDDDVPEPAPIEGRTDQAPDAAVAAQDGVTARSCVGDLGGRTARSPARRARASGSGPRASRRRRSSGSTTRNRNGLSAIDSSAPATMSWNPSVGSSPSGRPDRAEDERELADLGEPDRRRSGRSGAGSRRASRSANVTTGLATTISADDGQDRERMVHEDTLGSKSIPTDTKNSTANASRSGSASAAAWWLMSDSPTTAPARNAPSANETPNTVDETNAIPRAIASTASVNSSREPWRRDDLQEPWHEPGADDDHQDREDRRLAERQDDLTDGSEAARRASGPGRLPPSSGGDASAARPGRRP